MNKLQPLALGVAFGALWAFSVFCLAIFAMFGWGGGMVAALGTFYLGYTASIAGAVIGAIWAAIDGFIAGAVVAWIYNWVAK